MIIFVLFKGKLSKNNWKKNRSGRSYVGTKMLTEQEKKNYYGSKTWLLACIICAFYNIHNNIANRVSEKFDCRVMLRKSLKEPISSTCDVKFCEILKIIFYHASKNNSWVRKSWNLSNHLSSQPFSEKQFPKIWFKRKKITYRITEPHI